MRGASNIAQRSFDSVPSFLLLALLSQEQSPTPDRLQWILYNRRKVYIRNVGWIPVWRQNFGVCFGAFTGFPLYTFHTISPYLSIWKNLLDIFSSLGFSVLLCCFEQKTKNSYKILLELEIIPCNFFYLRWSVKIPMKFYFSQQRSQQSPVISFHEHCTFHMHLLLLTQCFSACAAVRTGLE